MTKSTISKATGKSTQRLVVSVEVGLMDRLDKEAEKRNMTRAAITRNILENSLPKATGRPKNESIF